ncbi:hypothetical protein [Rathayibacter soli]|uniref:hypothetical protein n=1 Tax=Rathayibacter soli TaxID=3144168 RepID=UPI0027E3FE7A|nr:hypothetical protein [Glaciibacter superstes]
MRSLLGEPAMVAAATERDPLAADLSIGAELAFAGVVRGRVAVSMRPEVSLASEITIVREAGAVRVDNLEFPWRWQSIRVEQEGVSRVSTAAWLGTYHHQLTAVLDAFRWERPPATEGAD